MSNKIGMSTNMDYRNTPSSEAFPTTKQELGRDEAKDSMSDPEYGDALAAARNSS